MDLLQQALAAAGGADRWRRMRGFTVHITIGGKLIDRKYGSSALKEVVIEAEVLGRVVRIMGVDARDDQFVCCASQISVESENGGSSHVEPRPFESWKRQASRKAWDILDLAQYCSYSVWHLVAMPYLLLSGESTCEILPLNRDRGEREGHAEPPRAISVCFSPAAAICPLRQILFFDADGLLIRTDYEAIEFNGVRISQLVSAHQNFGGYIIPTLRRSRLVGSGQSPDGSPVLDVEIFDFSFRGD